MRENPQALLFVNLHSLSCDGRTRTTRTRMTPSHPQFLTLSAPFSPRLASRPSSCRRLARVASLPRTLPSPRRAAPRSHPPSIGSPRASFTKKLVLLVQADDESPNPASRRPGPLATRPDAPDSVVARLLQRGANPVDAFQKHGKSGFVGFFDEVHAHMAKIPEDALLPREIMAADLKGEHVKSVELQWRRPIRELGE